MAELPTSTTERAVFIKLSKERGRAVVNSDLADYVLVLRERNRGFTRRNVGGNEVSTGQLKLVIHNLRKKLAGIASIKSAGHGHGAYRLEIDE